MLFIPLSLSVGIPPLRYLPYVGMVTIVMNDYPYVKYLLISFLGLLVLTNKE